MPLATVVISGRETLKGAAGDIVTTVTVWGEAGGLAGPVTEELIWGSVATQGWRRNSVIRTVESIWPRQ